MPTLEFPAPDSAHDEPAELEFSIAHRADELMRHDAGRHRDRNFWQEAEAEFWTSRLPPLEPAPAG